MKRGQIVISDELLREVLALPNNVHVVGVRHDPFKNTFSICLVGDGLPDACRDDGGMTEPKQLEPQYSCDDGAIVSGVCWRVG